MTEVEHQFHLREVLTCNVAHPEHIVLTSLQFNVVNVDNGIGILLVGQLNGNAADILVGIQDDREVVVVGSRDIQVGMEVHLSLPAVGTCIGHGDGVVVVAALEACLHLSSTVR